MVQVALKRPAVGHLLAAGDAGLSDPGEHEAAGTDTPQLLRGVKSTRKTRGWLSIDMQYRAVLGLKRGTQIRLFFRFGANRGVQFKY